MREIRRYDGNVNSEFPEHNRPSRQGSREDLKAAARRIKVSSVTGTKLIMASYVGNCIVKSN